MKFRTTAPAMIAPITTVALLLAGCGNSATTAATSTAPVPTATMASTGTPPVAGSTAASTTNHRPTMATGTHDHVGEFCSGRDQELYARESLMCTTGRLKPKK